MVTLGEPLKSKHRNPPPFGNPKGKRKGKGKEFARTTIRLSCGRALLLPQLRVQVTRKEESKSTK